MADDQQQGSDTGTVRTAQRELALAGRLGLAGRTAFYLLLAALTARVAAVGGPSTSGHGDGQVDASGALTAVSRGVVGKVAIGAVAAGFAFFGVARLVGAVRDRTVSRPRRAMTVAQGLFYLALAYVPASFLAGAHQTGSQQQQIHTVGAVLRRPAGREIVAAAGIIVIVVCVQQIRTVVNRQFEEGLDLSRAPALVRRLSDVAGVVGIASRACVFLPVGVFLIVAAVRRDPGTAYGTDGELLALTGHPWGIALLALVTAGLATFAAFSMIEVRYRRVVGAR